MVEQAPRQSCFEGYRYSSLHITVSPVLLISTAPTRFSNPLNPPKNICITAYVNHVPNKQSTSNLQGGIPHARDSKSHDHE